MSVSETNTPVFTAINITETKEKNAPILAKLVQKYKMKKLIDFLRKEEELELSETVIKILEKEEVNGRDFLKVTEEKLRSYGMAGGPATRLADFAKECKEKKLRSFSSYKTKADLEKVLQEDYKISSGDITLIPQFKPVTSPVDENSPEFKLCIDDILRRIRNMRPVVDSNEAMHCEYISTILHMALSLLEGLIITLQMK